MNFLRMVAKKPATEKKNKRKNASCTQEHGNEEEDQF